VCICWKDVQFYFCKTNKRNIHFVWNFNRIRKCLDVRVSGLLILFPFMIFMFSLELFYFWNVWFMTCLIFACIILQHQHQQPTDVLFSINQCSPVFFSNFQIAFLILFWKYTVKSWFYLESTQIVMNRTIESL
jgi:hypothetical protein